MKKKAIKRMNKLVCVKPDFHNVAPCQDCDLYYICQRDYWVSQMCTKVRDILHNDIFWLIY